MQKVFIHSDELEKWPYPPTCPFNTSRAGLTKQKLISMKMYTGPDRVEKAPEPAGREVLETFHLPYYLDALERANKGEHQLDWLAMGIGTGDCPVFYGLYDYGALAAGATILGAQEILSGNASIVFNPSGGLHHAFPAKSGGFCYINDIVFGCMELANAGKRVLFLDIDVHHCDGVQYAFYNRDDVMVISMHEDGRHIFPGTGKTHEIGEGKGCGYTVNLPLPVDTYDAVYLRAFREAVLPLLHAYDPDVFVLEVGGDVLAGDPLAHFQMTNNVIADIIELLLAFGKPILTTGGGGYNIENTVRTWALTWAALCGELAGDDFMAGMGGVMLGTTEWEGTQGLRDRVMAPSKGQIKRVKDQVDTVIREVQSQIFPIHGIK